MTSSRNKIALLFPGQGSQDIGMGEELCRSYPEASGAFTTVAQECDFDLKRLCWTGPSEALQRTCHTQPALLATSAAATQALRQHWPEEPLCMAGHSLGEITALWASGAMSLPEAARLTVTRGRLMEAAPAGAMAAIIGLREERVREISQRHGVSLANVNSPTQFVISGSSEAIASAREAFGQERGTKVVPLSVGGAFHSPLMEAANREFADAIPELASVRCPVVQNLDAKPHDDPRQLRDNLARQMTAPVLWSRSVETMLEMGVEVFVEIGSGKVLGGLIRKIDRSAKVLNVSDPASLEETVGELRSLTSSPA